LPLLRRDMWNVPGPEASINFISQRLPALHCAVLGKLPPAPPLLLDPRWRDGPIGRSWDWVAELAKFVA